jgi:hypothetical protein
MTANRWLKFEFGLSICSRAQDLSRRCSEPRTVLMPRFESMRMSFLARAVADLVSR